MKFNDIKKDYITVLRGRIRPFFAPLIRESKFDSKMVRTDRGHRIIEVPVLIQYDNLTHFRELTEDIAGWLVHNKPKILKFADEPDRFYYAVVDDTVNEDFLYNRGTTATLKFVCGYKYSHERQLTINDTLTSNIEGHKSTFWRTKTTFTEPKTSYVFGFYEPGRTNLRDKNVVYLNYNFVAGDVLEIDFSQRKVTLNGNDITNTVVILQSNFIELPIGTVNFEVSHKTEFYYNERYY